MKQLRRVPILLLLPMAFGIVVGAAWIFRAELLQHLVRPALESMLGSALDAEVGIEGLAQADGGLLLVNVSVLRRDGAFSALIPEAGVGFTLAGLLNRRLESLILVRPDFSLVPAEDGEPLSLPEKPPLEVRKIQILDGGVRYRTPSVPVVFHGIEVRTEGTEPLDFQLTAFAGEGEENPLLLDGKLLWRDGLSFTIERFHWQERSLLSSPLTLHFPSDGKGSAGGIFRLERLDSEQIEALFKAFQREFPLPPEDRFTLFSPHIDFGFTEDGLYLQGAFEGGTFRRGDSSLSLGKSSWMLSKKKEEWEFESDFALSEGTSGKIRGRFSERSLQGDLRLQIPDPDDFIFQFTGGSRPWFTGGLTIQGDLGSSGNDFRFEGRFEGVPGEKRSDYLLDVSVLSGPLILEKSEDVWSWRAGVRLSEKDVAEVRSDGGAIALTIQPFSGRVLHAVLGPDYRRVIPAGAENMGAELRITSEGEHWSGTADIRVGKIPLPKGVLEPFRLSGRFQLEGETIRLTRLEAASRLTGEGVSTGELSAAGSGEWGGGKWLLHLDSLKVKEMAYLSSVGDSGFTGGSLRATGRLSGRAGGDSIDLDLSGAGSMEEALYGSFYAELSDLPGQWSLRGSYEHAAALLRAESLSFAVEKIGSLNMEGRIAPDIIRSRGRIRLERLEGVFSERFLPALQERFAAARDLRLSGAVETEFALDTGPDGWHVRGTALPAGFDLSQGFMEARGLEGSVPFDFFSGKPPSGASVQRRGGTLSFSAFSLGPARYERDSLGFTSLPNRMEISGAASFRVGQGLLEIEDASFGLGKDGPEFSAAIDIRGIDLKTLTGELGWIEMEGSLDAELGRIDYAAGAISSEGNMVVEVFGGTLLISRIRMESPFSRYPLLLGSVDFSGIDLSQLTRTFSFGAINGIADGFVHDLRLFRFTPSRFEAVLETREKGTRNISVKALENLTLISQGGLSAALSRGVFRFIDFYRYRKIGIWCILDQDVFVLRGTARKGSERHIVNGGLLPPKIDILAPEHAISFKEMLNRLQRIERAEGGEGE